jgi:hypothetical protein
MSRCISISAGSRRSAYGRAFAEDTLAKFEVLSDLRVRAQLFSGFLNQHYQDKQVLTDRDHGFAIALDDASLLAPSQLSSGEQQPLALAYQSCLLRDPAHTF